MAAAKGVGEFSPLDGARYQNEIGAQGIEQRILALVHFGSLFGPFGGANGRAIPGLGLLQQVEHGARK